MIYTIIRSDTTTITLDCVQQFSESHTATATQHPVETGSAISDHVFLNNSELQIRGVVSDYSPSPDYITMSGLADATTDENARSHTSEIKEILMAIFKGKERVTIHYSASKYSEAILFENCVMTSVGFSDDPDAGEAIYPDLKFSQLRVVSKSTRQEKAVPVLLNSQTQQAQIDAKATADAANKTKEGTKSTTPSRDPEQLRQIAQNKTNSRIAEIVLSHPELSRPVVIGIVAKETGQTLTATGTITAGWTESVPVGSPIAVIQKTISKEEAKRTADAALQIEKDFRSQQIRDNQKADAKPKLRPNTLFGLDIF